MATTKKKDNRDIKALSTVEHILQRPNTYLGSTKKAEYEEWVFDDEDNLTFTKVSYVEGLKKCITEIIDNSVDEYIKTEGAYSNKINIEITKDTFTCEDNGRGIKVAKTAEGDWMPVLALCRPMSGSNFEDGGRDSIGTNGLGAKISGVFSKSFDAVTCDGKGKLKIVSKNNLSEIKVTELTPTAKTGTKVIYKPSGYLIAPEGQERVGDVSNVVFVNGAIVDDDGRVLIYYASSDTRLHVAQSSIERLVDYCKNTPEDTFTSCGQVEQRIALIEKNKAFL